MAVTFDFETISTVDGIVTRQLTLQPNPSLVPSAFAAVQFRLGYDSANITISERLFLPGASGVIPIMNPGTVSGLADTSQLTAAAITSIGFSNSNALLQLVYSHDANLDPQFTLAELMIDESMLIPGSIQFSAETAEEVVTPVVVESATVSVPLGNAGSTNLYWFTNDRLGLSSESGVAGGEIAESSILYLRMTANTFLSAQTLVDSGVNDLAFSQADGSYQLTLNFQNGSRSVLSFGTETGLLSGSVDTPASEVSAEETPAGETPTDPVNEVGVVLIQDGVNTGTGQTDVSGVEVEASVVAELLPAATNAFVAYRQRLGDAVAIEATNRDGSIVGKIIGDSDARMVRPITNGSTQLTVDLPAGVTLDLLGIAAETNVDGARQYLTSTIDAAVPATTSANAAWNASLKQSVSKASSDLVGKNFKLDVITPSRQGQGVDEIVVAFGGVGDAMGAFNLSSVDDVVTVSGYDALVAVGPGQIAVSGSSDASVYGDTYDQSISGGQGSDFLSGGGGSDSLTGGAGADTFELGHNGLTTITDLTASDQLAFDLFGISTVEQLVARITGVGQGNAGLRIQFDTFAVELVGYNDIGQISSGIIF